ncbi:Ig-like domain-containing protein [Bacillus sp. FJAT-49736]|uniref:Ig-like domain-containing protein n=1 Tax=Bacillus sp. FJAT-49736 TaxID=2833582 RepID=UPI001BC9654C|nr:Ig-like domain-containing protein [Bacillus sp. FJAT-49736]MBS4171708.1 Ig domain-containing protein [Bacillus sp. FJAT-49736]
MKMKNAIKVFVFFLIMSNLIGLSVQASTGDRQTPYSAFKKHKITYQYASFYPKRTMELQLKEIYNGEEANRIIHNEYKDNPQPKNDEEWILMKFHIKYVSGPEESLPMGDFISSYTDQNFFTPDGKQIRNLGPAPLFFGEFIGYDEFSVNLYPGGESDVIYPLLVKKSVGGYPWLRIKTNSNNNADSYAWFNTNPKYVEPIDATSVKLNKTNTRLGAGTSEKLTAVIQPENTTNKKITWASSNSSIAKVKTDGTVIALKAGSTIITAKTSNGKLATCSVTVVPVLKVVSSTGKSVVNNAVVNKNITVKITNNKLKSKAVTKNGRKITWPSSNTFTKDGKYKITVKDGYGKTYTFSFTIDKKHH